MKYLATLGAGLVIGAVLMQAVLPPCPVATNDPECASALNKTNFFNAHPNLTKEIKEIYNGGK